MSRQQPPQQSPLATQKGGDDLRKHPVPAVIQQLTPNTSVTVGDLHGNGVLMLYFLIKSGVLRLKDSDNDYEKFVNAHRTLFEELVVEPYQEAYNHQYGGVYGHPQLAQNFLTDRFTVKQPGINLAQEQEVANRKKNVKTALKNILDVIQGATVTDEDCIVRFIGDMLADRGPCDYSILLLLKKLHEKNNVKVHTLLSNHDESFIKRFPFSQKQNFLHDVHSDMGQGQQASLQSLMGLIFLGMLEEKEVNEIITKCYLPTLMLIDVSQNKYVVENSASKGEKIGLTKFYTHAPAGPNNIHQLALALIGPPGFTNVSSLQGIAHQLQKDAAVKRARNDPDAAAKTQAAEAASKDAETAFGQFADALNKKYLDALTNKQLTSHITEAVKKFVWTRMDSNFKPYLRDNLVAFNCHGHDGTLDFVWGNLNGELGKADVVAAIQGGAYWNVGGTPDSVIHATGSGVLTAAQPAPVTAASAMSASASTAASPPTFFGNTRTSSSAPQGKPVDDAEVIRAFFELSQNRNGGYYGKISNVTLDTIVTHANSTETRWFGPDVGSKTRETLKQWGVNEAKLNERKIEKNDVLQAYISSRKPSPHN